MSEIRAPKGTFDVLPVSAPGYAKVEAEAARILGRAGYQRIETPIFESTELFSRGVGESTDIVAKEMYSFDDGGGRSMTLRPEGTAPVSRAYIEHGMHKLQQPVRLWYSGSFFRHEAPQAGRFRQFHQIGAEAFGSDRPELDAEMVTLLAELLEVLGVQGLQLNLGTLGSIAARASYREILIAHLREREGELSDEVRSRIDANPLRAFDSSHPGTQEVMANAPLLIDSLDADDLDHFDTVKELLTAAGVNFTVDPKLVRGLDYYGRTVFEFNSDSLGAQSGVGGGGRYDGLIGLLGGPETPGIGWAAGVERILLAQGDAAPSSSECDLLVVSIEGQRLDQAFGLAHHARQAGLEARLEASGRSVKASLKHADRIGAKAVALIASDSIELKDLQSGEQTAFESTGALLDSIAGKMQS
ncbi:MAG: histidine--tRNA ligase [Solirubrobacterales bacterium]|nr:histidine--tRNA ligase [Solirubrobacterales bacterium]